MNKGVDKYSYLGQIGAVVGLPRVAALQRSYNLPSAQPDGRELFGITHYMITNCVLVIMTTLHLFGGFDARDGLSVENITFYFLNFVLCILGVWMVFSLAEFLSKANMAMALSNGFLLIRARLL